MAKEKGFWSRFKKEKKEPKGKEPGMIGSRSEGAAPVAAAAVAAAVVPDAAVNNAAKPPAGTRTRTIRKQKTWAGPEANPVSVRAESPPPRVKEKKKKKKGWKRFFGNW